MRPAAVGAQQPEAAQRVEGIGRAAFAGRCDDLGRGGDEIVWIDADPAETPDLPALRDPAIAPPKR